MNGGRSAADEAAANLIRAALAEDVGAGDITTESTVDAGLHGVAAITQKAPGCVYGHAVARAVFAELDATVRYEEPCAEGEWRDGGPVARITGPLRAILTGERTALNFIAHLSGVATATAQAVRAVEGTGAVILDTRKTTPGMRALEKAAVAAGGGSNHRIGLYDAVLIKENHIAAAGGLAAAVARCAAAGHTAIEVECRDLDEVEQALDAGARRILLDNMEPSALSEAVQMVGARAQTEASGGYHAGNVHQAAEAGVDFISLGAITHSAPALDLSLIVESFEPPRV